MAETPQFTKDELAFLHTMVREKCEEYGRIADTARLDSPTGRRYAPLADHSSRLEFKLRQMING